MFLKLVSSHLGFKKKDDLNHWLAICHLSIDVLDLVKVAIKDRGNLFCKLDCLTIEVYCHFC